MKLSDFRIGEDFVVRESRYRCTDIGSRVVVAAPLSITVGSTKGGVEQPGHDVNAAQEGWLNGPPYAVQEVVFDEYDMESCKPLSAKAA